MRAPDEASGAACTLLNLLDRAKLAVSVGSGTICPLGLACLLALSPCWTRFHAFMPGRLQACSNWLVLCASLCAYGAVNTYGRSEQDRVAISLPGSVLRDIGCDAGLCRAAADFEGSEEADVRRVG
jgi:hypothetical protein